MRLKSFLKALITGLAGLFWSGCSHTDWVRVKPWERATLTSYSMRPDRDPVHTMMMEHTFFSREIASGGRGVGGSGCGCN